MVPEPCTPKQEVTNLEPRLGFVVQERVDQRGVSGLIWSWQVAEQRRCERCRALWPLSPLRFLLINPRSLLGFREQAAPPMRAGSWGLGQSGSASPSHSESVGCLRAGRLEVHRNLRGQPGRLPEAWGCLVAASATPGSLVVGFSMTRGPGRKDL